MSPRWTFFASLPVAMSGDSASGLRVHSVGLTHSTAHGRNHQLKRRTTSKLVVYPFCVQKTWLLLRVYLKGCFACSVHWYLRKTLVTSLLKTFHLKKYVKINQYNILHYCNILSDCPHCCSFPVFVGISIYLLLTYFWCQFCFCFVKCFCFYFFSCSLSSNK